MGLSAVYHLSRKGYKVLGLERYGESGALGTASHGEARLWRLRHDDERYTKMMGESLELWKELEESEGKKLIGSEGLMWILDPDGENFKKTVEMGGGEIISNEDLKKKYPALRSLPDHLQGYFAPEAGIIQSHEVLTTVMQRCLL